MNASEEKQESSQRDQFMGCMKIYWKIVRDGFPLALFAFLSMVPLVSLPIFGGHENIAVLNVIALYMATDFTFMSNVNFSCGFAFQVNQYTHIMHTNMALSHLFLYSTRLLQYKCSEK